MILILKRKVVNERGDQHQLAAEIVLLRAGCRMPCAGWRVPGGATVCVQNDVTEGRTEKEADELLTLSVPGSRLVLDVTITHLVSMTWTRHTFLHNAAVLLSLMTFHTIP